MTNAAHTEAIARLSAATNNDPFALLGPHVESVDGVPALVVRYFNPDVERVTLLAAVPGAPVPFDRVDGTDLFEAVVPGWAGDPLTFDYKLCVVWKDGCGPEVVDA